MGLKAEQVNKLLKFGNEKYQIPIAIHSTPSMSMINELLRDLEDNNLVDALEYQFDGCEFPLLFHHNIEEALQYSRFTKEKKEAILGWIDEKVQIPRRLKVQADELYQPMGRSRSINPNEWEKKLAYVTERILELEEVIDFHNYLKQILQQGYDFHLLICTAGSLCTVNINFEKIIQSNNYFLRKAKHLLKQEDNNILLNKIQWRGTQKQLAELFVELQKKGWIEKPDYETIRQAFTKSKTINQVMKPTQDKKTKQKDYEGIYTPNYEPCFFGIKENASKPN